MPHFKCFLACALVLISKCQSIHVEERDGQGFLDNVLRYYGENKSISTSNLHSLVLLISARRPELIAEKNPLCPSVEQILSHYGFSNVSQLTVGHLERICPAVLTQVLLPSLFLCVSSSAVWGYGFLAVTVINLASLLGLLLIPLTKKPYFPKVLTYFIGLAIGTLFSNAVLQLIPEALGFDPKTDNYVTNAVGIFGGFYLLFFMEKLLKMALGVEHELQTFFFFLLQIEMIDVLRVNVTADIKPQVIDLCFFHVKCRRLGTDHITNFKINFKQTNSLFCDFVILLNAGMSIPQAIFFNLLSAMSCYVGLALGILVGSAFAPNAIFAIAGGMFLYIALADMFPEMNSIMREQEGTLTKIVFFLIQNAGLLTGFAVILLITLFAGEINLG
uniref:Solute carrier family 39 member 8 n=1 Tax=Myripristis murdjan TaxID=586833 RepID=A0A667YI54_9TELE